MKQIKRSKAHQEYMNPSYDFVHLHQAQEGEPRERQPVGHEYSHQVMPREQHAQPLDGHSPHGDDVTIFIDHKPYAVPSGYVTVSELRKLSDPVIGADKDLFRFSSGQGDDIKIGDTDVVEIHLGAAQHGRHFYSAGKALANPTEDLAKKAYFIYLDQGCQHGHDVEHWLAAERQMARRICT
jgi:hypothetical protein